LPVPNANPKEEPKMELYVGIDLHSNNNVTALVNESDRVVNQKRMPNDLDYVLQHLEPYREHIKGIVVESTFNWYWLVDGLMDSGYKVHLANPAAVKQYEGIKYTDDRHDAAWLARLLRLGLLPEGYIYPKEERPLRDLLRKRSQLVQQRTSNILSIGNLIARNTGYRISSNRTKRLGDVEVEEILPNADLALAVKSNIAVMRCLDEQIAKLEQSVTPRMRLKPSFKPLLTVSGVGKVLALTIMLETGDITRFPKAGNFSSYCRCVESKRITNMKRKGSGNAKNGNKYLAWAFVEAAHFAVRYYPEIKRFYQRKQARTNFFVAIKAVAHKLARASYYVMRDQVPFEMEKAFG
jgi:transposase